MADWVFPTNQIDINSLVTFGLAWNDVDVSSVVPAGTKAVFLHIRNTDAGTAYKANVRPNVGGAPDRQAVIPIGYHNYYSVSLDASYIFEGYFANSALDVNIVAYTSLSLFSNTQTDFSLGSTLSYVDCTATSGKSCAFLEYWSGTNSYNGSRWAVRKNGTSFDYFMSTYATATQGGLAFAGLDTSGIFEQEIGNLATKMYGWGLGDTSVVAVDSPTTKSPALASQWEDWDLSAVLPSDAVGVFLELQTSGNRGVPTLVNVRKKGSTDNDVTSILIPDSYFPYHVHAACGVDTNRVLQVYSDRTDTVFALLGYAKSPLSVDVTVAAGLLTASGSVLSTTVTGDGLVSVNLITASSNIPVVNLSLDAILATGLITASGAVLDVNIQGNADITLDAISIAASILSTAFSVDMYIDTNLIQASGAVREVVVTALAGIIGVLKINGVSIDDISKINGIRLALLKAINDVGEI